MVGYPLLCGSIFALGSLAQSWTTNSSYPNATSYDYIVVGSGPGGAPVAAQLARTGYSVLLMDAGDNQRANTNTSIAIALADVAAEDEKLRWDYFVRYHEDDDIANSYQYTTWRTPEGDFYVGQEAPEGSERLGVYYPRSGTLGGCSAHNAGAATLPQDSFWNYIAELTGDDSWSSSNMRRYFTEFERNSYLPEGTTGHGFTGWLATSLVNPEMAFANNTERLAIVRRIAAELGYDENELYDRIRLDVNSDDPNRDFQTGIYGLPMHHTALGNRTNANNLLDSVLAERNEDGSPVNDLTIQLESLVTRVLFDQSAYEPRAVGVEYMQGRSLYRADPRAEQNNQTTAPALHQVFARRGVVVSGGVFNTPQILKLSGVGPADELERHNIPVVVDLPGVGTRLQDDYEISLAAYASVNITNPPPPGAPVCTGGVGDDPCVELWQQGRGPYAISGSTHSTHLSTSVSPNNERDIVLWNPPEVFRGFFPGYSLPQGDPPTTFNFAMVHAQGRNHQGGTVSLRSNDPRDVPEIFFNFWAEGAEDDLQALYEGIEFARNTLSSVAEPIGPFTEFQPCIGTIGTNCSEQATKDFIRRQVYSHHASSTAAIGADDDDLAVLDSEFRVRGTQGLYVVDGSALPRPASPFPIIGQFMMSYKAAEAIIRHAASATAANNTTTNGTTTATK